MFVSTCRAGIKPSRIRVSFSSQFRNGTQPFSTNTQSRLAKPFLLKLGGLTLLSFSVAEFIRMQTLVFADSAESVDPKTSPVLFPTIDPKALNFQPSKVDSRRRGRADRPTPGKFDDLDNDPKHVADPQSFTGLRFSFQRHVQKPTKQVSAHINFVAGAHELQGGHNSDFMLITHLDKHEFLAGFDGSGRVNGKYKYPLHPNPDQLGLKIGGGFRYAGDEKRNSLEFDIGYVGADYNLTFSTKNAEQFAVSYLQSITEGIALGVSGLHSIPSAVTELTFGGRYRNVTQDRNRNGETYTFKVEGNGTCTLGFNRTLDQLDLAGLFIFFAPNRESVTQIGARWRHLVYEFHGGIDSTGLVKSTLNYRIGSIAQLMFSTEMKFPECLTMVGLGYTLAF